MFYKVPFEIGDIVYVCFDLPRKRETKTHPAIIISNINVYEADDIYICVIITNTEDEDLFSFPLDDSMFENRINRITGQARGHLITYVLKITLIQ